MATTRRPRPSGKRGTITAGKRGPTMYAKRTATGRPRPRGKRGTITAGDKGRSQGGPPGEGEG